MYSPVPSGLERVVPASISKNGSLDEWFDLMGYALPPGTVVATQSWSMHRDPAVFPSPDNFIPERWLQGADATEKMAQYLMPFGIGSRQCGGMNLAYMMLRITVATLARNFNVTASPETDERSMEIKDAFVSFPFRFIAVVVLNAVDPGYLPSCHGMQARLSPPQLISVRTIPILHLRPL